MCNGNTGRKSEGGTIIVFKPADRTAALPMQQDLALRLVDGEPTTSASIAGWDSEWPGEKVIIHRDGDLRSQNMAESTILHRNDLPSSSRRGTPFVLDTRIDLGVGGNGIIGRRVSLLHGQRVIGRGIVGWN